MCWSCHKFLNILSAVDNISPQIRGHKITNYTEICTLSLFPICLLLWILWVFVANYVILCKHSSFLFAVKGTGKVIKMHRLHVLLSVFKRWQEQKRRYGRGKRSIKKDGNKDQRIEEGERHALLITAHFWRVLFNIT